MLASLLLSLTLLTDTIKQAQSNLSFAQLYDKDYCTVFFEPTQDTVVNYTLIPTSSIIAVYFGYSSALCNNGGIQISDIVVTDTSGNIVYLGYVYFGLTINQTYNVSITITTYGENCTGIDNICPYYLDLNPLAVELCGYTLLFNSKVQCQFMTCSSSASKQFLVDRSADLVNWTRVCEIESVAYSSTLNRYAFDDYKYLPGVSYYRVIEEDLNGNLSLVFTDYIVAPEVSDSYKNYYDLSGRLIKIK